MFVACHVHLEYVLKSDSQMASCSRLPASVEITDVVISHRNLERTIAIPNKYHCSGVDLQYGYINFLYSDHLCTGQNVFRVTEVEIFLFLVNICLLLSNKGITSAICRTWKVK